MGLEVGGLRSRYRTQLGYKTFNLHGLGTVSYPRKKNYYRAILPLQIVQSELAKLTKYIARLSVLHDNLSGKNGTLNFGEERLLRFNFRHHDIPV